MRNSERLQNAFENFVLAAGIKPGTQAETDRMFRAFCAGVLTTIDAGKNSPDLRQWMQDVIAEIDERFSLASRN